MSLCALICYVCCHLRHAVGSDWCFLEGCALLVQAKGQGQGALVDKANTSALVSIWLSTSSFILATIPPWQPVINLKSHRECLALVLVRTAAASLCGLAHIPVFCFPASVQVGEGTRELEGKQHV